MNALFACYHELRNAAMDYMNIIYFEFDWTTHIGNNIYPHIFLDVKLFLRTYMERNVHLTRINRKKTVTSLPSLRASFDIDVDVSRPDVADRFESASRESRFRMITFAQLSEDVYFNDKEILLPKRKRKY